LLITDSDYERSKPYDELTTSHATVMPRHNLPVPDDGLTSAHDVREQLDALRADIKTLTRNTALGKVV